ncbi:MAG: lamin tail domain-containing protein [Bacteroidales bacterium]|nr:lamin tail domain-containing protein [Bacteroidales bacterium]MCF8402789.1 lamin tail domain-containing protein [Bacteroidales bacterium]
MKRSTKYFSLILLIIISLNLQPASCQVVINEYSASNLSTIADNYSKYEDWIELYNAGGSTVDIGGYFLSDKTLNKTKWQFPAGITIPAGGFITIWASGRDEVSGGHYHSNFKLSQTKDDPEHIILSLPDSSLVDSVQLLITRRGHSRGRTIDGSENWSVFGTETPGNSNNTSNAYLRYCEKPTMSVEAGFYTGSVLVELTTTEPNSEIHYTTNGTEPTGASPLYTGPISITSTTILIARTYSTNSAILKSLVVFNTYFIDVTHTMAVMSTSAEDLDNLLNGNQSLRPFGTFEYFNEKGNRTTFGYGEFNEHGQDSWVHDQRSIDYISRDECGINYAIRDNIIPLTDRDEFQRIILRAAGDDNYPGIDSSALLRDYFVQNTAEIGDMNLDVRRGEKGVLYVNGQYWGIYGFREKVSDHDYTEYYYNQDKYNIYFLKLWGWSWAEYGGQAAWNDWNTLHDFIKYNDMSNQSNFDYVKSQYDYTSLVDYVHINSFVVCSDWINWNVGWWKGLNPDGGHKKWGYILWDEDATFAHYINYTGVPGISPTVPPCFPEGLNSDPEEHIYLLNKLRDNPEFDQYYITRYIDLYNTVFQPERMIAYLDSIESKMAPEFPNQVARWGGSVNEWENNVQKIRNFITARHDYLAGGLKDCYNLDGPYEITVDVEPAGVGNVQLNSMVLDQYVWSGDYFGGIENKLKAIPTNPNYEFDKWVLNNHTVFPIDTIEDVTLNLTMGDNILAMFKVKELRDSVIINEINYNSLTTSNSGDWVELKNRSLFPIDISGWVFKDENDAHIFVIPQEYVIAANSYVVLCNDTAQFKSVYPEINNILGNLDYGLSGTDEVLRLYNNFEEIVDSVHYYDSNPWTNLPDGYGPTLELKSDTLNNDFAINWRASFVMGGTPGEQNSIQAPVQLYINEFMADNDNIIPDPQGEFEDWIELYNAGEQYINIGGKYFTDFVYDPTKHHVSDNSPDSTIILPGEFLLFWADSDGADGILHLEMKLAASGEYIGVYDEDGVTVLDSITFGPQSTDISYGRISDGNEEWVFMTNSTPGASNAPEINLSLKVFLEGPFNGTTMNTYLTGQLEPVEGFPLSQPYNVEPWNYPGLENVTQIPNQDIVDWVLIELRDASNSSIATQSTTIAQQAGFILNDGRVKGLDGVSNLRFFVNYSDSLYAVVRHRNHLGIMSAYGLKQIFGGIYSYDFTNDNNQAYGGSLAVKEIATDIWGMISGDANANGIIDNLDKNINWVDEAGVSGYFQSDLNLDSQVDNTDKNDYWRPNEGQAVQVPD